MAYQKLQGSSAQVVTPGAATDFIQFSGASTRGCIIYIGVGGDLNVITSSGDNVTFVDVPSGSFLPVQVMQVVSTLTTATSLLAIH